jgi:epoxyqueuosine reductase
MHMQASDVDPVAATGRHASARIKAHAASLGFDLVGIAPAEPSHHREYLRQWLDDGKAGTMQWLARRFEQRADPAEYCNGVRSAVCVAMNYHAPLEPVPPDQAVHHGRVARYALGDDYHELIKPRLHALADWIRETFPGATTRCSVDTAPVLERELAARAGIGWVGKNTCVVHPKIGSWLLLGEVFTTLDLPPDDPIIDRCGSCRRCIDACPTAAITAPYQLDARRCISYLNIEHQGPIDPALSEKMGDWLVGCDICQEVCPFNRDAPDTTEPSLHPRLPTGTLDLREVLTWQPNHPNPTLSGTAIKRIKLPVLQRNARAILHRRGIAD